MKILTAGERIDGLTLALRLHAPRAPAGILTCKASKARQFYAVSFVSCSAGRLAATGHRGRLIPRFSRSVVPS